MLVERLQSDDCAGNVTGAIEATIVPVGAAYELFAPNTNNTISFYENTLNLNTSTSAVILASFGGVTQYANNALHGFGRVSFTTREEEYLYTNYGSYVAEWAADFNTGTAVIDVFKLASGGRVDGAPIPALLPPGGS
ncbi:hypothetical protein W97_07216 [Coniosporium apollinis CBS 100218]|uniref:Uncharacterized protein n=1 Tax=Coniosporium apollinis (strain CBS 100218) TaxID=1168221 RepID=R7Z1U7_CONA1|nr:uncharacterized protein W97_07216 [Coniosporium apollinis CBS 100218]EON68068.1 hypothetical protein W97_07216 [Coniosporium apollinis CBS 100218]